MNRVNDGESPVGKPFVFGGNGNGSGAKDTTPGNAAVTPVSDEEEFSTPVGDFVFGSEKSTPPCNDESRCLDVDSGKTGREGCRKSDSGDGKARDGDS